MPRPLNILIAEDSVDDVELIVGELRRAGFDPTWTRVETEPDFLAALAKMPDLILSDYAMPQFNGLRAAQLALASGLDIPFILISGTIGEDTAVAAMKGGATDYLIKDRIARLGVAVEHALAEKQIRVRQRQADAALALFRTLIDQASDGIEVSDPETGRLLDVNQATCEGHGYTREEMLTLSVWDIDINVKDRRAWSQNVEEVRRSGFKIAESLHKRKDGTTFPIEVNVRCVKAGREYVVASVRDITERKRAETALLESRRFLRSTLDALSSHIAILDEQGTIVEVNAAWHRFASENNFVGKNGIGDNYLQVCDSSSGDFSEEASPVADGIRVVMAGQQTEFHLEYPCHRSKERRWFVVRVTRFASDGPVRVVVAHENITERMLAEDSLRRSEERFRELAENINEVFWITDPTMHELFYVSPAYEKIWGRSCASRHASPRQWLEMIHPEDSRRVAEAAAGMPVSGQYDVTYRICRPDKTERWIHDQGFPVRDAAGEVRRIVGTAEDITEKRRLEAQFREAQKMEAIGQLAGGIAHDFNNILGAIGGNLYLAKQDAAEHSAILEYLENIAEATQRATELVREILTFSRQDKAERSPVKLNLIVKEALKLLRASLPAGIRIETDLTDTPTVLASATAIHQVIMNLGTNAWHAMRNQNGVLKVELNILEAGEEVIKTHPDLNPGRYVQLSVSDTGCGMDRATLEHIFEPFFTTKAVGEGTGLGLAVVHGIMKSHDGGIYVYSQPGQGTRFVLYFPVVETEVMAKEIEAINIPRGRGEHILFVDDESVLAGLGKKMLERLGYIVTIKTDPLETITVVQDHPGMFDLVITDLTMPGMDGTTLGRRLLQIQPGLAIILTTGFSGLMTTEKVRELGFRELLIKPCTALALAETVHRVLQPAAPAKTRSQGPAPPSGLS
jgi:PAS domain S-box-containing protein